ncbi:MAG: BREX system ATP-binding domain-containing protein [Actinomycetota bacterium]
MRELIGRDRELHQLEPVLEQVAAGAKRGLVLSGPAGIGKTALLRWVHQRAVETGFLTAFVRVPAAAGLPPRFPIGDLLSGLVEACHARHLSPPDPLIRVVGTLRGTTSANEYPADLPQVARALEATAALAPIGIFIDDYQWIPPDSANLLLLPAIRGADGGYLLATSVRSHMSSAPIPYEPSADLWVNRLDVSGLDALSTQALAEHLLDGPVLPSLASLLYAQTSGNPLFMMETLRALREQDVVTQVGGYWRVREGHGPGARQCALQEAIEHRMGQLRQPSNTVAQALAVLGRDVRFDELAGITKLDVDLLVATLEDLMKQGLVNGDLLPHPRFQLAHPMYDAVLRRVMGPLSRSAMHERAYAILSQQSAAHTSAAELAHHALNALRPPATLTNHLRDAALEAFQAGSYREAADWYGHLVSEIPSGDGERCSVLTSQAEATARFDPQRAAALYALAIDVAPTNATRARILIGRSHSHRMCGSFADALADLKQAAPLADHSDALNVRHAIAVLHGIAGHVGKAETELRALVKDAHGTPTRARAIGHLGLVAFTKGQVSRARRLWEEALTETNSEEHRRWITSNLVWLKIVAGEWNSAREMITRALDAAISGGDVWDAATLCCSSARLYAWAGDLPHALDEASRALDLAAQSRNPACKIAALDALGLALLEAGRPAESRKHLQQIPTLANGALEPRELSLTFVVLSEACLHLDDVEAAVRYQAAACKHLPNAQTLEIAVRRVSAQIELATGRWEEALLTSEPWLQSRVTFPYETARIREIAARALFQSGRRTEGLAQAAAARNAFSLIGAKKRSADLERFIERTRPATRGRPRSAHPSGITDRELEILVMVADGMLDSEIASTLFLSRATVKKHVDNIRRKLGVSRRAQIPTAANRAGISHSTSG